jgi:hypothetical protein
MVVNTSNWWSGHRVLLSPEWIQRVSWAESRVDVALERQSIKEAPAYHEDEPLNRDAEMETYNHYGRKIYWRHEQGRAA